MSQEKDRQYDGRSRPTNDIYRQRWDEIFGKKEELEPDDQEYLDSLKEKL